MGSPSLLQNASRCSAVELIFGVAIAKSALLTKWIGPVGIAAGVVTIAADVVVA
jgi:hypothetical protein